MSIQRYDTAEFSGSGFMSLGCPMLIEVIGCHFFIYEDSKEIICLLQSSLESKNAACKEFLVCLKESLAVWGARLPTEARYSR